MLSKIKQWMNMPEENAKMRKALERLLEVIEYDCEDKRCGAAGSDCDACYLDARKVLIIQALKGWTEE